jgi:hypothetical protein
MEPAHGSDTQTSVGIPIPAPPTASPEPSPVEVAEKTIPRSGSASLPPLPLSSSSQPYRSARGASALDGAHAADAHDLRSETSHARKLHARQPGLETVSHRELPGHPDKDEH